MIDGIDEIIDPDARSRVLLVEGRRELRHLREAIEAALADRGEEAAGLASWLRADFSGRVNGLPRYLGWMVLEDRGRPDDWDEFRHHIERYEAIGILSLARLGLLFLSRPDPQPRR